MTLLAGLSAARRGVAQELGNIHLNIFGVESSAGGARAVDICCGNEGGEDEGHGGEEAKGALDPIEGIVHGARRGARRGGEALRYRGGFCTL